MFHYLKAVVLRSASAVRRGRNNLDIKIEANEDLQNWGAWVRSQPDPFKHLNYGAQPMFNEYRPSWRDSAIDDDYASMRNDDFGADADRAAETDRVVRMMPREEHKVYLYAYFCEWGSKRKISEKFGESRRNVDVRLAKALGAYEVLFELKDLLKKVG